MPLCIYQIGADGKPLFGLIDGDDVILVRTLLESQSSIADADVQVRHRHAKILLPNFNDLWIEFVSINGDAPIHCGHLAGCRPRGKPYDGNAFYV